jgi:excinuclease ABC subunit B
MQRTIDETERRRSIQIAYNEEHGIDPTTIYKSREDILGQKSILDIRGKNSKAYAGPQGQDLAADPVIDYMDAKQIDKMIKETERKMKKAAKDLDFIEAAQLRDELFALKKRKITAVEKDE